MIDIEGLDTVPTTTILTVGAQLFDPLGEGVPSGAEHSFYARVTTESQPNRTIDDGTVEWWSKQAQEAQDEAFNEEGRIPLKEMLNELYKMVWKAKRVWANGPTYDMTILEHAFKQEGMSLPWQYHQVRDTRTVYGLWPDMPKPEVAHHALDDCWRQIALLQATLQHLNIKDLT